MTRRSRAARPAAQEAGGPGDSVPDAAGAGAGALPPRPAAPPQDGGTTSSPGPASVRVRWDEQAHEDSRDVWDVLPFPPQGPGVLGLLRDAVARCSLFRGGAMNRRWCFL